MNKISVFDQNFNFWPTFQFLTKISIFCQNFNFWPQISPQKILRSYKIIQNNIHGASNFLIKTSKIQFPFQQRTHSAGLNPDLFSLNNLVNPWSVNRFVSAHCFSAVSREWWTKNWVDFFSTISELSVDVWALSKMGKRISQNSRLQVSSSRLEPWAVMRVLKWRIPDVLKYSKFWDF